MVDDDQASGIKADAATFAGRNIGARVNVGAEQHGGIGLLHGSAQAAVAIRRGTTAITWSGVRLILIAIDQKDAGEAGL